MSVLNFLSEETFNEQMDKANQYLKYIAAGVGVGYTPKSFAEIQQQVRAGRHKELFSVGDQIICTRNNVQIVWDIIGMDIDTPSDPQYTHSLTSVSYTHLTLPTKA